MINLMASDIIAPPGKKGNAGLPALPGSTAYQWC
jgi:hypothetical protein